MRQLLCTITLALALAAYANSWSADPEILTMSAAEESGGTTQADLDIPILKMLERRSVEMLESKMRNYLAAQGQTAQLPKLQSEAHYVETGGTKLAVVRIRSPKVLHQVFVYGIKGDSFLRVACVRTSNFDQAIPLFYGPCGDKLGEVFGVSLKVK
jgi:hypothetical protein